MNNKYEVVRLKDDEIELDVIISVGYKVHSKRGVLFRECPIKFLRNICLNDML